MFYDLGITGAALVQLLHNATEANTAGLRPRLRKRGS